MINKNKTFCLVLLNVPLMIFNLTEEIKMIAFHLLQENENDLPPETPDSRAISKEFTLRQAKMNRELQELNRLLEKKETLATQMTLNDDQMKSLREQHEVTNSSNVFYPEI